MAIPGSLVEFVQILNRSTDAWPSAEPRSESRRHSRGWQHATDGLPSARCTGLQCTRRIDCMARRHSADCSSNRPCKFRNCIRHHSSRTHIRIRKSDYANLAAKGSSPTGRGRPSCRIREHRNKDRSTRPRSHKPARGIHRPRRNRRRRSRNRGTHTRPRTCRNRPYSNGSHTRHSQIAAGKPRQTPAKRHFVRTWSQSSEKLMLVAARGQYPVRNEQLFVVIYRRFDSPLARKSLKSSEITKPSASTTVS
jgi:hypothetical protein